MSADPHIRAKELIVSGGSAADQRWLQEHLRSCPDCAATLDRAQAVRAALHSASISATPELVAAAQQRVLRHALVLAESEGRRWMITASIAIAALFTWISVPLLWQAANWIGNMTLVPQAAAITIFVSAAISPALLAAAAAMAARSDSPKFGLEGRR
jgi:hypothetical protein